MKTGIIKNRTTDGLVVRQVYFIHNGRHFFLSPIRSPDQDAAHDFALHQERQLRHALIGNIKII